MWVNLRLPSGRKISVRSDDIRRVVEETDDDMLDNGFRATVWFKDGDPITTADDFETVVDMLADSP